MQRLPFLSHIIAPSGIAPDPTKIEAVQKIQPPQNITQLRSFLGLAGYYRQFIQNFSAIAKPLNRLLQKDEPYRWTHVQQEAFDELKDRLTAAPILAYPNFRKTFISATDASYYGLVPLLVNWTKTIRNTPLSIQAKAYEKKK